MPRHGRPQSSYVIMAHFQGTTDSYTFNQLITVVKVLELQDYMN